MHAEIFDRTRRRGTQEHGVAVRIRGELKRSRSSCAKCSVRDIRVVTKWTCSPTAWEMRSRKQEILTRSFSLAQDLANASAREFPSVRYWHCCAWLDTWALTFRSEIVPCRWARTCPIFSHKSALSNWRWKMTTHQAVKSIQDIHAIGIYCKITPKKRQAIQKGINLSSLRALVTSRENRIPLMRSWPESRRSSPKWLPFVCKGRSIYKNWIRGTKHKKNQGVVPVNPFVLEPNHDNLASGEYTSTPCRTLKNIWRPGLGHSCGAPMWVTMPVWIEILCEVCIGGHCFIESISFLGRVKQNMTGKW